MCLHHQRVRQASCYLPCFLPLIHFVLRGARDILVWIGVLLEVNPASCARLHYAWANALAAAVISIVFISYFRD
jgi:hypothetical protein